MSSEINVASSRYTVLFRRQPRYRKSFMLDRTSRRSVLLRFLLCSRLSTRLGLSATDPAAGHSPGIAVVISAKTGRVISGNRLELADRTVVRPGSAIKPFVLEVLRERGANGLRIACPVELRIGNRRFDCTHPPLNEAVDEHRAIVYSCNNWFAEASRRLSAQDLRQGLLRYGFGAAGAVDLSDGDDQKRMQAIGEWGVRVSPLAMAQAYWKLSSPGDLTQDLLSAATFGTAQLATPLGASVAAKTGTTSEGAWVAGWIPADKPKFVVVVWLPAGSGGSDAAPIAREIFTSLMEKDPHGVKVQYGGASRDVPFEEYVAGVVAGEAGTMVSEESRKAMAVAARTWAAAFRGRHRAEGFDFCSTTHCQEYRPAELTPGAVMSVRATAGEMLWWEGRPALAYYSKDCGGVTEAGEAPYLPQQEDPWCRSQGHNEWRASIEKSALHASSVRVLARTGSGRVAKLAVGKKTMTGQAFRLAIGRELGWNLVRSDAFELRDMGTKLEFRGTGAGHGIGLCQVGAGHMGQQGRNYRDILSFYYPGAALSRFAKGLDWKVIGGERVRVMTTDPAHDGALVKLGDTVAAEVAQRIGLAYATMPLIRMYPSVAAYRDGTGEPGWVAGSTQARVIRLQPAVSREVLKHELMHELIEQHSAPGLPMWFREDLVTYLTGRGGPVRALVNERGEPVVLGWITAGLPRELKAPAAPRQ